MKVSWALVSAAIVAVLNWLVGFGWSALSADQAAAIIAAINDVAGIVVAWRARPVSPSVFTLGISALAALGSAYGLHLSQQMVAAFASAVVAVLALVAHGHISPAADAPYTGVLGRQSSQPVQR